MIRPHDNGFLGPAVALDGPACYMSSGSLNSILAHSHMSSVCLCINFITMQYSFQLIHIFVVLVHTGVFRGPFCLPLPPFGVAWWRSGRASD